MYARNKLRRKTVKHRTWKLFKRIRKFIAGLADRRVGVIKAGAFTRNRKLSYLSVSLTILDVGRETLQIKLCRVLPKMGCEECSQQALLHLRYSIFSECRHSPAGPALPLPASLSTPSESLSYADIPRTRRSCLGFSRAQCKTTLLHGPALLNRHVRASSPPVRHPSLHLSLHILCTKLPMCAAH